MLIVPQNSLENLRLVRDRIAQATQQAGRSVDCVTLIAVSKAQPASALQSVAHGGQEHFGESYVPEALGKIEALKGLELTWHFIGQIQANKTRPIAEHFAWVHGIDRLKIAQRLSDQRPYYAPILNVCLQVNIAGEKTKGGALPAELPQLVKAVAALPRLKLRGLMCIPPEEKDPTQQRYWFGEVRRLFESLNADGADLDTLSMGMSGDLESAIREGATMVRVGTALFGARPAV